MTLKPPNDPVWYVGADYAKHKADLYADMFCAANPGTPKDELRDWLETLIRDAFNLGRCFQMDDE